MLGFFSENFPRTGALGLAIMGGAGVLSASFLVPLIGTFYDKRIAAGSDPLKASMDIQAAAGLETLGKVAAVPVVLTVVFILVMVARKKQPSAA